MNRVSCAAVVLTAALGVLLPRTATSEPANPTRGVVVDEGLGNGLVVIHVVLGAVVQVAIAAANRVRKRRSL